LYLVEDRDVAPIESLDELTRYFHAACKPRERWRVGTEHELCGIYTSGPERTAAPPYEGERGIRAVFEGLVAADCWSPVIEGEHVIALSCDNAQVTIEPGGQLELAARPVHSSHDMARDLASYGDQLAAVSRRLGIAWLGVGFRPYGRRADVPWMPKGRYVVMRDYMPTRGALAHEMMLRTATVQTNLDYSDAADALAKLRCTMSVTPILTALYANSPIVDGADSGYQSYRALVWTDTDPDRCGLLPFAFDDGDVFEAYTRWALDVPMFFVYRGGYCPAGGMTFRQFFEDGFHGARPTMDDWGLHLSTLFPEARLKSFLEVRGCDCGTREMVLALGPLCRGLLYDADAREAATALTAGLSFAERQALHVDVARRGLAATLPGGRTIGELARELCAIAREGVRRITPDELALLAPVEEVAATGRTQADAFRELWNRTGGDPDAVIDHLAHPGLGR
jgi:glutamate--cysteine ligase